MRGAGGASGGSSGRGVRTRLFTDDELRHIEEENPDGLTAERIDDLFASRGLRFSEATFRKYVQRGLVRRSRP